MKFLLALWLAAPVVGNEILTRELRGGGGGGGGGGGRAGGTGGGGSGGPPTGGETTNNLAVPLLEAESTGGDVAPDAFNDGNCDCIGTTDTNLNTCGFDITTACCVIGKYGDINDKFYLQKEAATWDSWILAAGAHFGSDFVVSAVDVGDRLESPERNRRRLIGASKVRVEATMKQNGMALGDNVKAMEMHGPFCDTSGITEEHGTTGNTIDPEVPLGGYQAIVTTKCPHYYAQLLTGETDLKFDYSTGAWGSSVDTGNETVFASTVPKGEITVSGKSTYGWNMNAKKFMPGMWRLTFVVEPNCGSGINAQLLSCDDSDPCTMIDSPGDRYTSYIINGAQYDGGNYPSSGGGVYIDVPIAPNAGGHH